MFLGTGGVARKEARGRLGRESGGAVSSGGSRGESLMGHAVLKRAERKVRGGRQPWGEPGRELGGRFEGNREGA